MVPFGKMVSATSKPIASGNKARMRSSFSGVNPSLLHSSKGRNPHAVCMVPLVIGLPSLKHFSARWTRSSGRKKSVAPVVTPPNIRQTS